VQLGGVCCVRRGLGAQVQTCGDVGAADGRSPVAWATCVRERSGCVEWEQRPDADAGLGLDILALACRLCCGVRPV
jgi:hypothetical protein